MKKGELEIDEIFVIFLLLIGIVTASIVVSNTQKTGDILGKAMGELTAQFYKENPTGQYTTSVYTWSLSGQDKMIDDVPYGTEMTVPDDAVLIDDRFPINMRAAEFRVAERKDVTEPFHIQVAVVAVGNNTPFTEWTPFDKTNFNMSFYDDAKVRKTLEYCSVYDAKVYPAYVVYYAKCLIIWNN
ncbi:MAG: hypothetical protein V1492_06500 [Candidatus Micrarchaeota archaeon]